MYEKKDFLNNRLLLNIQKKIIQKQKNPLIISRDRIIPKASRSPNDSKSIVRAPALNIAYYSIAFI